MEKKKIVMKPVFLIGKKAKAPYYERLPLDWNVLEDQDEEPCGQVGEDNFRKKKKFLSCCPKQEMAEGGGGAGAADAPLTWPSVISFLQHEYRRFELERSDHALEVTSLKVRGVPSSINAQPPSQKRVVKSFIKSVICKCSSIFSSQLRIATLETERAQQEKHKLDLIKRIKMLEHVLDSERYGKKSPRFLNAHVSIIIS